MSAGELLRQANQLKRSGKLDEAIALYHQVIEINPHFAWAYHGLGDALVKQGNLESAVKQLQLAIKINPNSALSHYYLGEFLFSTSDLTGAIESYDKAIKVNPNIYRFYESLARAWAKTGNVKRARDTYQQAVKLKPDLLTRDINFEVNQSLSQSSQVQYLPLIFGDIESAKTVLGIEKADDWVEIYSRAIESQLIKYIPNKKNNGLPSYNSLVAHYSSDGEKIIIISSEGHKEQRVCLIKDESGNGNHLVQSKLNKMPILQVDKLNDKGKLRFDNVRQTLLKSCGNLAIDKPQITWFTVFSPGIEYNHDKQLPHGAVFRAEVNNFPGFYGTFIGNGNGLYYLAINCRSEQTTFQCITETKFLPCKIYLLTATWDGIGDRFTLRINGCVVGEINNVVPIEDFNHGLIGIGADTNNNHNFNGDFYELLVYKSVLQLDDIVAVEKHLCQKWGIEHPGFKIDDVHSKIFENPNFSWYYYYLGEYFAKLGYTEKASQNYNLALTLKPNSQFINYQYGKLFYQKGNINEARHFWWELYKQDANIPTSIAQTIENSRVNYIKQEVCFVHIPKTGGKSINRALYGTNLAWDALAYHQSIRDHKFKANSRKFCVIRNPFSFYVSLYHFFQEYRNEIKNPLRLISDISFSEFIYIINDYQKLKEYISKNVINLWHHDIAYIESENKQIGFFTNYYLYMCFNDISILRLDSRYIFENHDQHFSLDRVIKLENLPKEFESLMKEWEIPTLKLEKLNSSNHQHWEQYYNQKTKQLVLDKDWLIFKLYYPDCLSSIN